MDQVDPTGDRLDPVHDVEQVLAAGVGVAGVEAEADAVLTDRVPEPGERVEPAGARVVAAGGVLDQHLGGEPAGLGRVREGLPPVVEALRDVVALVHVTAVDDQPSGADCRGGVGVLDEQLATGDPDPVVQRRHVDHVRRVDVDVDLGGAQPVGVRPWLGCFPALGIGEEELHRVRLAEGGLVQRVRRVDVGSDTHEGEPTCHRPGPASRRLSGGAVRRRGAGRVTACRAGR